MFNTDPCEGLPADLTPAAPKTPEGLILPQAEGLISATDAGLRIGGDRAFYSAAEESAYSPAKESADEFGKSCGRGRGLGRLSLHQRTKRSGIDRDRLVGHE